MGVVRPRLLLATMLYLASSAACPADLMAAQGLDHLQAGRCEEAAEALNQGLKAGEPGAYFLTGFMLARGVCVKAAPERAPAYLEPAAKAGESAAVDLLVEMHGYGLGVPQSYAQAGRWATARDDIQRLKAGESPAPAASSIRIDDAERLGVLATVRAALVQRLDYPGRGALYTQRYVTEAEAEVLLTLRLGPEGLRYSLSRQPEVIESDLRATSGPSAKSKFERSTLHTLKDIVATLPPYARPSAPMTTQFAISFQVR